MQQDCFGNDSIFGRLYHFNSKIIFLGAAFQSCTFIHFVEQYCQVPYRYFKTFKGTIKDGKQTYEDECRFFVRYLDKNVVSDLSRLEQHLLDKGLMKRERIGYSQILAIQARTLFDECVELLKQDLFFLLKDRPQL